jgi:protein kinase-like protein
VPMAPPSAIDPHQGLPSTIRAYRVLGRLAKGGTSDVVLACAEGPGGFERVVVLKLLLQQFRSDGRFERMFFNEAAAYARLSHPAIVRLYDFFAERDRLVLVLEHVDGLPLNKVNALLRATTGRLDDAACLSSLGDSSARWRRPIRPGTPERANSVRSFIGTSTPPTCFCLGTVKLSSLTSGWRKSRVSPPSMASIS